MRTKGDKFRKLQAISDQSESNDRLAADVSAHFGELATLMSDDASREAFQLTYMAMTRNYVGNDVVGEFRKAFFNIMREMSYNDSRYKCVIIPYNDAISTETEEETQE
jgi:hypothetical protein